MTKIEQIQEILGVDVDNDWGPKSEAALLKLTRQANEVPDAPAPAPADGSVHPFIPVAAEWMGTKEPTPNHFDGMERLWADTNYPDGYTNREPYCAAFQCFVVAEAARRGAQVSAKPVTPSVSEFRRWGRSHGFAVDSPRPGDHFTLLPAGVSHMGLVQSVDEANGVIHTLEGNTDPQGSREGDGFWPKVRRIKSCDFIRIPVR